MDAFDDFLEDLRARHAALKAKTDFLAQLIAVIEAGRQVVTPIDLDLAALTRAVHHLDDGEADGANTRERESTKRLPSPRRAHERACTRCHRVLPRRLRAVAERLALDPIVLARELVDEGLRAFSRTDRQTEHTPCPPARPSSSSSSPSSSPEHVVVWNGAIARRASPVTNTTPGEKGSLPRAVGETQ